MTIAFSKCGYLGWRVCLETGVGVVKAREAHQLSCVASCGVGGWGLGFGVWGEQGGFEERDAVEALRGVGDFVAGTHREIAGCGAGRRRGPRHG